ncbi:hypothetical protein [Brachybacterium phenoliresistens]|uniref:hypothetical protein n=1 Tax=Brachybacterium phenoliresistens TaxID=396014 RepID=UPI0031D8EAA7
MDISPPLNRLLLAAILAGTLGALTALIWLLAPGTSPLATMATPPPLVALLGAGPMHGAQLLAALLCLAAAAAARARGTAPRGLLLGGAALAIVVPGLAFGSMATLSHTGYMVAFTVPVLVVASAAALIRRGGTARWAVGVPVLAAIVVGLVAGRAVLGHLAAVLLPALARELVPLASTALFVGTGAIWTGIGLLALAGTAAAGRIGEALRRHRRLWTIVAACGPLPYALARLTWLTPWPLFGGEMATADPATRVWGLALSGGCWLGTLLTIGLIRPWGEVFPRWFPAVGGRPVPVALAAIPGFTVAALLCFAAVPVVLSGVGTGIGPMRGLALALVFPCWIWGPSLALAVAGYVAHRRAASAGSRPVPAASARMAG